MRFCSLIAGGSFVLVVGWKAAFAGLFGFVLGGPTAPTGVERRSVASSVQGSGKADEVGIALGLGLGLGLG